MLSTSPRRVLVARLDNLGDVLLSGPAVRAVAATGAEVVYLCSPQGRPAAVALPGVTRVVTARAPWIDASPRPTTPAGMVHLVDILAGCRADEAIVFTSFHQSPLPLALLMRMAGVERISAISSDYPGSLLDVRHRVPDDIHEVERALSLAAAAGYRLPAGDDRRLRVRLGPTPPPPLGLPDRYVVVHGGASVPARSWPEHRFADLVGALTRAGHHVVLTGGPGEAGLTARLAGAAAHPGAVTDLAGRTDFPALAAVIAGAGVVVCGNTGPAHVAAATGTAVVSIYAPTVPAARWRPWMTRHTLLGVQDIPCAGCRARVCPVEGHPCVEAIPTSAVVGAAEDLMAEARPAALAGPGGGCR